MKDIVLELYDKGMIKFGEFTLSSGRRSCFYINLKILPSFPQLFKEITEAFIKNCLTGLKFDVICGIATGGIPLASFVSFSLNKPLAYVRKERKEYGAKDFVVGLVQGKSVLVVDDVATTGDSLARAIEHLREEGGNVTDAAVIVMRNDTPLNVLRELGVKLRYLLTGPEVLKILLDAGKIDENLFQRAIKEL
ncbi:MAG: orotate phosphoribosyltransferase [Crenarchaeota archaeon]|nr:orotate phosphoribosyltransferase [Thermoproteota archaeon]MCR8500914.1 orotate phosphoribosyltransferase [Thermoproteota archaeon]